MLLKRIHCDLDEVVLLENERMQRVHVVVVVGADSVDADHAVGQEVGHVGVGFLPESKDEPTQVCVHAVHPEGDFLPAFQHVVDPHFGVPGVAAPLDELAVVPGVEPDALDVL